MTHTSRPSWRRWFGVGIGALLATTATGAFSAEAFKPYTHNASAQLAYDDVVDDGHVTVGDREYPVRPELVNALRNQREYYNAGVIGPDGFPDLAFGQSQIHPEQTGKWLEHLYEAAWAAQADPARTAAEKEQILAFTYGFMTHAAGDVWAHTLINQIADGIFPGVGEIANPDDLTAAEIALRHVIAEGYVGDATPGYDGNPARAQVPGAVNEDGDPDVSDDSTPGYDYAAPTEWLYEMLVDPAAPLPVGTCGDGLDDDADGTADDGCPGGPFTVGDPEPQRGPLIDFFLDLQADLEVQAARWEYDGEFDDCGILDPDCYEVDHTLTVPTVRGVATTTVTVQECIGATIGCVPSPVDLADDLIVNSIGSSYMRAWIADIETGLQHWPELGLQLSKALFDANTYRDAQNHICRNEDQGEANGDGFEENGDRESCEDGIGLLDVVMYTLGGANGEGGPDGFIPQYLLSMLGAPDFVGDGFEFAVDALGWLEDLLATVLPDIDIFQDITAAIEDLLMGLLSEALGFDVELLADFLKHPTHWMEVQQFEFDLPFLGEQTVNLFEEGDREFLDGVMGLEDPVITSQVELPDGSLMTSVRLKDDAEWSYAEFAPGHDALVMSKLLLLDGAQLNSVVRDGVGTALRPEATVATYADAAGRPANVMIDALDGGDPWLLSIDSDHAWRADRLPVFEGPGGSHHGDGEAHYAGRGQFPLWESCLARPVFRSLFRDWENGAANFPDLGDATSPDPSVTAGPSASVTITGSSAVVDGTTWVGGDHGFVLGASDAVFTDGALTTRTRTYPADAAAPAWTEVPGAGATFALPADAADGAWIVEWEVSSPCRTTTGSMVVSLDRTAPTIGITEPAAAQYDTDDLSSIQYTVDDGDGSGVLSEGVTFDGSPASNGQVLDMFTLDTGSHEVIVTATDHVGNTAVLDRSFLLLATSVSLRNNVDRALGEGLVSDPAVHRGLADKLDAAVRSHVRAKHDTEINQLEAVLNQIAAQRGHGIDVTFADRMTGWVVDLIASEG